VDSPAHWPGASRPLPLPVGRGGRQRTRAPWRHATSLPACVPRHRDASGFLLGAASNPWTPSLVPFVSPSPLPLAHPNASAAAARHHRGHRHPGDTLRFPRAPTSTPIPPRRAVQRRTPPSISTPSSSTSRRRRSPSPPRLLRPLPEPTDQPCGTAVSSYAPRPSPRRRVRPLAPIPNRDRSISPPAMA